MTGPSFQSVQASRGSNVVTLTFSENICGLASPDDFTVSDDVGNTYVVGSENVDGTCDVNTATLTLAVPSFLAKERIEGRYLSMVRDALTEIGGAEVELALEIAPSEPEPEWTVAPPTPSPGRT